MKLKKVMALTMAGAMAATTLTACGSSCYTIGACFTTLDQSKFNS